MGKSFLKRLLIGCLALTLSGGIFFFLLNGKETHGEDMKIVAVYSDKIPVKDVHSPVWEKTRFVSVKLYPQNIVSPKVRRASVKSIRVKVLYNTEKIAFLLEWDDKTRDALLDVDKYTDQVAIQLPLNPSSPPSFMMGQKGGRVHIIHWKAIWQDDIEKGYRDVDVLYPNYWVDLYWMGQPQFFGEGEIHTHPPHLREFISPEAEIFIPGFAAKNPMAVLHRKYPVEEVMAEGFGTLTTQPRQNASGWGVWENGKWRVIIARPLVSDDPLDAPITKKTYVAFAVWDGSKGNVGARKNYSPWIELILKKK